MTGNNGNTAASITAAVRRVKCTVQFLSGSTVLHEITQADALKSVTIEKTGDESKFFGFGICQKINVKLVDINREFALSTSHNIKVYFSTDGQGVSAFPVFYISEIHRNEKTNELSITGYDIIYQASKHTVSELQLTAPYTLENFANACAAVLTGSKNVSLSTNLKESFALSYENGANFDGTETIREALDALAEATQTVYRCYIGGNSLSFVRLSKDATPALTIDKSRYFELDSKTNRRLSGICHCTELGDNVTATTGETGTTQYIRDNPFWELREDIGDLVSAAVAAVGGLTINQFSCSWRGDYRLTACDKLRFITKDGGSVDAYLLNDTVHYDGSFSQKTAWSFTSTDAETDSNPAYLGETLKQTYARVDKANKRIDLVASETGNNTEQIAALQVNTNEIAATVQQVENRTTEALEGVNGDIETLTKQVEATMTAEDVKLEIQTELANGVDKVTTSTGFTFNEEGLTVEKSGSEMSTRVSEDGMTVFKSGEAVLTADNTGVNAVNLHATTYLIIGTNSRFEDYNGNRTGCFWLGS